MVSLPADHEVRMSRARLSLMGLSVGDALGERFFGRDSVVERAIAERTEPPGPWSWTDDTAMALSIVATLERFGDIDADFLARAFARRYELEPQRGYGGTAHEILADIASGKPWREVSAAVFGGEGSMGNGAAMRVAPIGAYFADDLESAIAAARTSALPTHANPDAQAGAIAVAVAAAVAWQMREAPDGERLLATVVEHTPEGLTRHGLVQAIELRAQGVPNTEAAKRLGSGYRVLAWDTVPFALLCASRHLDSYEEAFWETVAGLGDRDTTCAMVGGVVAMSVGEAGIPGRWVEAREPLL
ncbi:ADP-ribosylglycohydrolase family protein [Nannocystis pusilla]|uniref:ADP-ribosylglycohydrolase family protein n=1 Tax=Nannocystis pusilla TaxID=889268 RepID=UPI003BF1C356